MTGILCLEGGWDSDFGTKTVKPVLDLIGHGMERKPAVVHRSVATQQEFEHLVWRWRRTTRFNLLYIALHGDPGVLYLGHPRRKGISAVTLDDLATMLGTGLAGRHVHLGSCGTIGVDRRHLTRFLARTGLSAVSGFTREICWLRSAIYEALVLPKLLRYPRTRDGMRRMERAVMRETPSLRRELGFRLVLR